MALILIVIDGTKSLAANGLVFTSMGETWTSINAQSLSAVEDFVSTRFFGPVLDPVIAGLVALPGWLVLAVPGVILAMAGRSRRARVFVRQDQT